MRAKSAMTRSGNTNNKRSVNLDYQMEHQSQKSKILDEDRKNFMRQAQEIKQKNKQEMQKLRQQNKKLKSMRDQFISSKKNGRNQLSRTAYGFGESGLATSAGLTQTDENLLRRQLDKERHETRAKKKALFTLQDKLKEVESNKLKYIEESPLMRNIRLLENRLDKVMIKYNEAQSVQQTYETVVKRLKEERVGYDSQLAAIELSLKGKEHDFQELLLLAHDATHAKQTSYGELKRFEQRRLTVQEMRHKYLADKKDEINRDAPEQEAKLNQSRDNLGSPSKSRSRGNSPNPNANSSPNANTNLNSKTYTNSYKHDQNYQRQELSDYQEAFRKLKEVTGVIDANQIIQKFKTQGLTTSSLQQLKEAYRQKIETLRRDKEYLKKHLEDKKFLQGQGQGQPQWQGQSQVGQSQSQIPGRKRLDEIEAEVALLTNQQQRLGLKWERLSNQLINAKAGIQHMRELTQFYKREGESSDSQEDDLRNINEKLRRMYDVVKSDPVYAQSAHYRGTPAAIRDLLAEGRHSVRPSVAPNALAMVESLGHPNYNDNHGNYSDHSDRSSNDSRSD